MANFLLAIGLYYALVYVLYDTTKVEGPVAYAAMEMKRR